MESCVGVIMAYSFFWGGGEREREEGEFYCS